MASCECDSVVGMDWRTGIMVLRHQEMRGRGQRAVLWLLQCRGQWREEGHGESQGVRWPKCQETHKQEVGGVSTRHGLMTGFIVFTFT